MSFVVGYELQSYFLAVFHVIRFLCLHLDNRYSCKYLSYTVLYQWQFCHIPTLELHGPPSDAGDVTMQNVELHRMTPDSRRRHYRIQSKGIADDICNRRQIEFSPVTTSRVVGH